jgi:hypothetical protein
MRFSKTILFLLVLFAFQLFGNFNQDEQPEFRLDTNRDFGYGNGSDVRGSFSLTIYGDQAAIRAVTYSIDGSEMGKVEQSPFRWKFKTTDYPDGWHELTAAVETTDGRSVTTPVVSLHFASAADESKTMGRIFLIAFILFLVLGGVGLFTQFFAFKGAATRQPGYQRNYGYLGGTICPRCRRPYPIHITSLSLLIGRLDRCENCGKWALVHRYPIDVLRAAELAEIDALHNEGSAIPGAAEVDDEARLRKKLDESKYIND